MLIRSAAALGLLLATAACHAQTLQLPTFRSFSTNSSALVPDRGTATLGGVGGASAGSSQFGPLGARARGGGTNVGGLSVTVQIYDMHELDQAVLAEAAAKRARLGQSAAPALSKSAGGQSPAASLAEIEARKSQQSADVQRAAGELFEKARAAEAAGKLSVARIYYQMAARRAEGELQRTATARANALASVR